MSPCPLNPAQASRPLTCGMSPENRLIVRRHLVQSRPLGDDLRVGEERKSLHRVLDMVQPPVGVDARVESRRLVAVGHSRENAVALAMEIQRS